MSTACREIYSSWIETWDNLQLGRREWFVEVCIQLRLQDRRFWKYETLASLILEAGDDWTEHPCPLTVTEFRKRRESDLAGQLRQDLAGQLRQDVRRARKRGIAP